MNALLAHPGTQHSFRLAAELSRLGLLGEFHTTIALRPETVRTLPHWIGARLANRALVDIPVASARTYPSLELSARTGIELGGDMEAMLRWRNKRFQEAIPT